ncbi:Flp pilus assembly protein, pilin Flp [Terriglobus roseus DSM 18391]|uniref:Flp pilus assembly protein, pilin Flp n=1 Tax=Terriglobus roseus (strain DSM 18391 / NRRL B-41598 / KBS 63) TaxID=926566 RepID=I3ZLI5_TERRK|nr:Flp family type IVb pilin [Terriglobus roseus]AFL90103.1 Flp pilus assembly protein, pilin Flp [Terriglobus roseus DSM 18391]
MKTLTVNFKNLLSDESGQDLIEYALIASLVGLVAIATLRTLGTTIAGLFTTITTSLTGV